MKNAKMNCKSFWTILFTKVSNDSPSEIITTLRLDKLLNIPLDHGLRTPNEGINQKNLKNWADVADKICFGQFGIGI